MSWKNKPLVYDNYVGFVYTIQEIDTGMEYIGIKNYWKTVKYPPLKGRKNKRHRKVETDWKTYNTSSPIMQKKLEENPDNYIKRILSWHTSKSELKATEAYWQLKAWYSGNWSMLYNEVINLRVRLRKDGKENTEKKITDIKSDSTKASAGLSPNKKEHMDR